MVRFRNFIVLILAPVLLQGLFGQQQYLDVEDIKEEWKDFTSFQRQELVNYTNFLYNEGFYERALLGCFQFLYKYPKDKLEIATYFQIAKSYENKSDWLELDRSKSICAYGYSELLLGNHESAKNSIRECRQWLDSNSEQINDDADAYQTYWWLYLYYTHLNDKKNDQHLFWLILHILSFPCKHSPNPFS